MTAAATRNRLCVASLLALVLVAGCASGHGNRGTRDRLSKQISELGLDPDEIVFPFELTPEMRAWVHEAVPQGGSPLLRLQRLLNALLLADREQPITYQRGVTHTARDVWATRRANCLSFTHLFVGLARELDIPVYYLRVSDLQRYEKDGDLVVASEHVTAAYGPPASRKVLDFTVRETETYRSIQPLSDLAALALFYSNQGAERIRDGSYEAALRLLDTATRLDPQLPDAWLNRGVALRRLGRPDEAEESYWRALEIDPGTTAAQQNLAALLATQGRTLQADELLALVDRRGNRNPFSYLALGDLSMREGRLSDAERYYRRARRLFPDHAEPLAALGQLALEAGRLDEAERMLRRAERQDPTQPRVRELERRILRTSASHG